MAKTRKHRKEHHNEHHKEPSGGDKYTHLVRHLMSLSIAIKIFHWTTHKYSSHKNSDELFGELNETLDRLVENLLGMHKNIRKSLLKIREVPVSSTADSRAIDTLVKKTKDYLMETLTEKEDGVSSLAIRDEFLEAMNKYLYLSTLN
jgi:hypothetical protein